MRKVSLESLGLKHYYSKITTSSITTNARLQQVTFTCLLKNHKMLPGYHPFFSPVSQSYKSLRIILFFLEFLSENTKRVVSP